ncbi:MAG TPA: OLD family endonuclease [Clostridiales bacterium]|nr:MAG: hypothetical protein A2Y22_06045 [Clostridiales bacterium GWD2_32_59]HAN10512.1 OLD family endonuclease [Clostridiales bacterium]
MSKIRVTEIEVENYRSFGQKQKITFPESYDKPIAIVGYNNAGKTNLMNAIRYGLYEKVSEDMLELKDFHNCEWKNVPWIRVGFRAEMGQDIIPCNKCFIETVIEVDNDKIINVKDDVIKYDVGNINKKKWHVKQQTQIIYINFHTIKEEIKTQKGSWGYIKSFLGRYIKKTVDNDTAMLNKKEHFERCTKTATETILKNTKLSKFIEKIRGHYSVNLRQVRDTCEVQFGLPNYEDIFQEMIFKIGLNGDNEKLIPLNNFGDGYISMFVMAVIQAISEDEDNKCLFLFEEPESFLHENHQEYFYKTVLCGLAKKGHQVIYTTHSDRMVDMFDTRGLVRLEFDESNKQTEVRYNKTDDISSINTNTEDGLISMKDYNQFVKAIDPSLNKIIFSKKVILVEGPNDVLVYKHIIKQKILEIINENDEIEDKMAFADTYMNFYNIAIVSHYGKATAILLMRLCNHLGVDYFAINDWDLPELSVDVLLKFSTLEEVQDSEDYTGLGDRKGLLTTNWNLYSQASHNNIHFNVNKLEELVGYKLDDKNSMKIQKKLQDGFEITEKILPEKLYKFLALDKLER